MIFSIPRSKSFMQHFSSQKHHCIHSFSSNYKQLPIKLLSRTIKSKQLFNSHSESHTSPLSKQKQNPKKQMIYNKCRSKSYDKYLIENKKKVQKQIILKNLNPQEKRIYEDSEENKKIYSGKKLVDPFNQKFNYFIKQQHKPQQVTFVITQFLLEPCKINSKRLEYRPFIHQNFINQQNNNSQSMDLKKSNNGRNCASSFMTRTYQHGWKPNSKNQLMRKANQDIDEFSMELVSAGPKIQSKQFEVQPWQLDPASNNLDSIKIH